MASSFIIEKEEAVVLLDTLSTRGLIPISISHSGDIEESRKTQILNSLIDSKVIKMVDSRVVPDKGLDPYLLPIATYERVLIYKRTNLDNSAFCATVYFSKNGITAIVDTFNDTVSFISLTSFRELLVLVPPFSAETSAICYILIDALSTLTHLAICTSDGIIKIVEAKRTRGGEKYEQDLVVNTKEYKESLTDKLSEVYHAVNC